MAVDPTKLKAKPRRLAVIEEDGCSGCGVCVDFCPVSDCIVPVAAPEAEPWIVLRVVVARCIGCSLCAQFCPWETIVMLGPSHREAENQDDREAVARA